MPGCETSGCCGAAATRVMGRRHSGPGRRSYVLRCAGRNRTRCWRSWARPLPTSQRWCRPCASACRACRSRPRSSLPRRFRLFDSITAFLTVPAACQPWLVILYDLHWADAPSLVLLSFVARKLRSARLLVLVGTCCEGDGGQHALAEILPVAAYFRLRGLGEPQLARSSKPSRADPSAPLVAAVYQRTEGNPLFVTELRTPPRRRGAADVGVRWGVAAGDPAHGTRRDRRTAGPPVARMPEVSLDSHPVHQHPHVAEPRQQHRHRPPGAACPQRSCLTPQPLGKLHGYQVLAAGLAWHR